MKLVKKTSMPNYDCRVKTDKSLTVVSTAPTVDKTLAVTSSMGLSLAAADIAALQAAPSAAIIAIGAGIATGLGLAPNLVEVTKITYPDGTVATPSRRLSALEITVEYTVYSDLAGTLIKALAGGSGLTAMAAAITSSAGDYFEGFSGVTVASVVAPVGTMTKASTTISIIVNSTMTSYLTLLEGLTESEQLSLLVDSIAPLLNLNTADFVHEKSAATAFTSLLTGPVVKTLPAGTVVGTGTLTQAVFAVMGNLTVQALAETTTTLETLASGASDEELLSINTLFEALPKWNDTGLITALFVDTAETFDEEVPIRRSRARRTTETGSRARRTDTADSASWTVTTDGASVGEYFMCFTDGMEAFAPIPDANGAQFLTIPAPELRTERQVFGGQKLSARSGETNALTLAGARLPLLAFGSLSVVNGACGLTTPKPNCTYNATNKSVTEAAAATAYGYGYGYGNSDTSSDTTTKFVVSNVSECVDAETQVIATGTLTSMTTTGYTFAITLGAVDAGAYSLCYCDASGDNSLEGTALSWAPTLGKSCDSYMAASSFEEETEAVACTTKCDRGCSGADCYCDSYLSARADAMMAHALCLPPSKCTEYCANQTGCTGIDISVDYENLCWLTTDACELTVAPSYDHWEKNSGTACSASEDFSLDVGDVAVTGRPRLDGDFVLAPDADQSVEIVGSDLDPLRDRVYVTWETGVCGFSAPVGGTIGEYAKKVPALGTVDPPADDTEGPYVAPVIPTADYRVVETAFCGGSYSTQVLFSSLPAEDLCYPKCGVTSNDDPTCAGLISGVDDADTSSLCLTKTECLDLCTKTESCYGISMHRTKPRCYLNADKCADKVEASDLTSIPDYDFYYKVSAARRKLSDVSTTGILRFAGLTLGAGRYKACFCDHLSAGICKDLSDFAVDVGRIHVSGVSCLLSDPKYVRGVCVPQSFGGLRCYDGTAPTIAPPVSSVLVAGPESTILPAPVVEAPTVEESSWCLYGPEEETSAHPICDFVTPAAARRL
jgi:hypothetical protein